LLVTESKKLILIISLSCGFVVSHSYWNLQSMKTSAFRGTGDAATTRPKDFVQTSRPRLCRGLNVSDQDQGSRPKPQLHEFSSVLFLYSFRECHEWSEAPISAYLPWATQLLSQCMLHWWQVNGSTARELFPCTRPSTLSTRLDRSQVTFSKSSV